MATAQTQPIDDLLAPILTGHSTAGIDLHSDPLWFEIQQASKSDDGQSIGGKTEGKEADWPRVRDLTRNAIATRSKDLSLAVLLTEANVRLGGFAGLAESLRIISGLLTGFWENLYPLPFDGDVENRARVLSWLNEKLRPLLWRIPLTRQAGKRSYTYVDYMESLSVGGEDATFFPNGDTNYERKKRRDADLAAGRVSKEMWIAATNETSPDFLQSTFEDLGAASRALNDLEKDLDEKFQSDAPATNDLRESLQKLHDLLKPIVGKRGGKKLEADPPPTATPAKADQKPPEPNPAGTVGAAPVAAPQDAAPEGPWAQAEAKIRAGFVREGVFEMMSLVAQENGRNRFLRKLGLAEMCLTIGREPLAVVILEELTEQIASLKLENWESPSLIGRVWGNLYKQYRKLGGDKTEPAKKLYLQLCRLDPWQGIRWGEDQ